MLRKSARCIAKAQAAIAASRHPEAVAAASEGLSALPASPPATLHLALLNAHGLAMHFLGELDAANDSLTHAVTISNGGIADDEYIGIGGCLIDLAANHMRRGDTDAANVALKRSRYMLDRAYRPSNAARACHFNVRGLLHESCHEYEEAFEAQQQAHKLFMSAELDSCSLPISWKQASRSGSVAALLRLDRSKAAQTLITADMERMGGYGLVGTTEDRCAAHEMEYVRSLAAIASLLHLHDCSHLGAEPADEVSSARTRAALQLREVAYSLGSIPGISCAEVSCAQQNADAAFRYTAARDDPDRCKNNLPSLQWQRHWQPALGCGITILLSSRLPNTAIHTRE